MNGIDADLGSVRPPIEDKMPLTFDENGIQFQYPDNWELITEQDSEAVIDVSVQAPNSGFWSLQCYTQYESSQQIVGDVVAELKREYEDLEVVPTDPKHGEMSGFGFDFSFFCLDFVVTGRVMAYEHERSVLLILYQAESREFESIEPVFHAITTSMLESVVQ